MRSKSNIPPEVVAAVENKMLIEKIGNKLKANVVTHLVKMEISVEQLIKQFEELTPFGFCLEDKVQMIAGKTITKILDGKTIMSVSVNFS